MPPPSINLKAPTGVWRPVYAHRSALHGTAEQTVLAAWQADVIGVNLAPAVRAWRERDAPDMTPAERLQAAASVVLACLSAASWSGTLQAVAAVAQRAHRAGFVAGETIASRDRDDDTDYADGGDTGTVLAPADLSDQLAAHTAAAVLATTLRAVARRLARLLLAGRTSGAALKAVLSAGADIVLAADTAVSAAYGAGLLAAYISLGAQALAWITAGDDQVCAACQLAETNSPYSPFAAPTLPAHPNCRCILAPA